MLLWEINKEVISLSLKSVRAQIYRAQYGAAILVCGTPSWRPENSKVNVDPLFLACTRRHHFLKSKTKEPPNFFYPH